jgi:hypothetical protein
MLTGGSLLFLSSQTATVTFAYSEAPDKRIAPPLGHFLRAGQMVPKRLVNTFILFINLARPRSVIAMLEYQIRTTRGIGPVTPNPTPNDDGRVVPFRRPGAPRWRGVAPRPGPVPDLAKFERADTGDDYRHRMMMNVLGFLVTIGLIVAGLWLVDKIAEIRKDQDCYLSGRRNCAPIEVPPVERG